MEKESAKETINTLKDAIKDMILSSRGK